MSSALTNKTYVLITRVGPIWVTKERGEMAMRIKEQDPASVIEIDGSHYSANIIMALVTAQQYSDYQNEKRGMWQCQYQKWHPKFDNCECARNIKPAPRPQPPEMTDEERLRARKKLDEIRKNIAKKGIRGLNDR